MKSLTIHQPWASLLVWKKKQFETRDWQRMYRGLIAIHAGKEPLSPLEDYYDILWELRNDSIDFNEAYFNSTFGKIIAIARLKNIHLMTRELIDKQSHLEQVCGYWEPGRFAWEFTDIQPLPKPISVRGLPGLWDISDEIQQQISQQLGMKGQQKH
jgi:hypothetical protein